MLLWYRRRLLLARFHLWPSRTILRVPLSFATAVPVDVLCEGSLRDISMDHEQSSVSCVICH
jgi:hypothetical protein